LTSAGEQAYKAGMEVMAGVLADSIGQLTEDERVMLLRLLQKANP